tara:strand:+ start:376 stop:945 length:570 start_codon:yes stop_codon:yes gene_type:complete
MLRRTVLDELPVLHTERLVLRLLDPARADLMVHFRRVNRDRLKRWEPRRSPEYFTEGYWRLQLRYGIREFREGRSVCFTFLTPAEDEVVGVANFTNIVRGTFEACHLGYSVGGRHEGRGMMKEGLQAAIGYMFDTYGLHRIMANYLPHNERSGALLAGLGFEKEGFARAFLQIDGVWEDHVLTSLINDR